jgi:DNA repair protein RecN (Recombination protein N)
MRSNDFAVLCFAHSQVLDKRLLLELRVENYAVIDNAEIEFGAGLNLLTGETGAGKSILIEALALLLGERASNEVIRHGAAKATVSAVFDGGSDVVDRILEEHGLTGDGSEIILRREISPASKGRVFINSQAATVAVLKRLAPELATVHAQMESLLSFDGAERLRLLDEFAGIETEAIAQAYARQHDLRGRIADLQRHEQDRLRLLDLWSFQNKEIASAELQPGEEQRLEGEKCILANAEKLCAAATRAFETLYESELSAAALLRLAARNIEELARYDPKFKESLTSLEAARITAEDLGATMRDYAHRAEASPQRLAEIEDRLAHLDRLKRKYGATVEEVIAFGEEVGRKLSDAENHDRTLADLGKELTAACDEFLRQARAVSKKRQESARRLARLVESDVNEMAMKAQFRVEVTSTEDPAAWSESGFDEVRYLVATNPGEPLQEAEKIASGGELSRIVLALKAVIACQPGRDGRASVKSSRNSEVRTVVFDEIDTGIGGRAAEAVGRKLKALSRTHQVLCITHLPQIACFADQHYLIEKRERREAGNNRVRASIRRLSEAERTQEIARMLSGAQVTPDSLRHAEQMLKAHA